MRSLILAFILCLGATPVFACVFYTDCKPGSTCVDSVCSSDRNSSSTDDNNVPVQRPKSSKSCAYDSDCREGARCIKGSGLWGVCLGG